MQEDHKRAASLDFAMKQSGRTMLEMIEDAKAVYAWLFPEEKPSNLVLITNVKQGL